MRLLWLALIGGAGGFMVSGGMYALITTLGIINRFAQDTHTASQIILYEECVIWGATLGNVVFVTGKIIQTVCSRRTAYAESPVGIDFAPR